MNSFSKIVKTKSNGELLKMVYEFDEWSPEMLEAVQEELTTRNELPSDLQDRKQKLIEVEESKLQKGKDASLIGQIVGWLTVFGLLGIYIGYNYTFSKVKGKHTEKQFYKYNESSRKNGSYLFYTSIILSTLGIIYKLIVFNGSSF